jgi:Tfp pilus assembly protein PilF
VNQTILGASPSNVPAHIRLGRAYEELSLWNLARTSYKAALRLHRSNALAQKRLDQLNKKHPPIA